VLFWKARRWRGDVLCCAVVVCACGVCAEPCRACCFFGGEGVIEKGFRQTQGRHVQVVAAMSERAVIKEQQGVRAAADGASPPATT
jgi:hypothetical protein